jgi:hypothetical protein
MPCLGSFNHLKLASRDKTRVGGILEAVGAGSNAAVLAQIIEYFP